MDPTRMIDRGVQFTERQLAKLSKYKIVFNKKRNNRTAAVNIAVEDSHCVYGALYTCKEDFMKILDNLEVSHQYKQLIVKIQLHDGMLVDAVIYTALPGVIDDKLKTIDRVHLDDILRGGKDILPPDYVEFLKSFYFRCVNDGGDFIYYFGYGSNMDQVRMLDRGIEFTERQLAKLTNFEFMLNKKRKNGHAAANIVNKESGRVYGALYTCTKSCLEKLDKFENVRGKHYKRINVKVELHDGSFINAVTYSALPGVIDNTLKTVNRDYLEHILCGRDILPPEYIRFLESFDCWCVDETSP